MYPCFVCDQMFEFGNRPGVYNGKPVQGWGVMICNRCKDSNWDGLRAYARAYEKIRREGNRGQIQREGLDRYPSLECSSSVADQCVI